MSAPNDRKRPPQTRPYIMSVPPQDKAGESVEHDAVFGELTQDGPNYRNVSLLELGSFDV